MGSHHIWKISQINPLVQILLHHKRPCLYLVLLLSPRFLNLKDRVEGNVPALKLFICSLHYCQADNICSLLQLYQLRL